MNEINDVDRAEKVILELKNLKDQKGRPIPLVTTSKLRNLLSLTADIYNDVIRQEKDELGEDICSRIEYLRVRFLYEAGRERSVKSLVEKAGIIDRLKGIHGSKKNYIAFNRYMEALVAFHKFYGGKDN